MTTKRKEYIIRCDELDGHPPRVPRWLKQVNRFRIVATRWMDNARGFATADDAQAMVDRLKGRVGYKLVVVNRAGAKLIAEAYGNGTKVKS